MLEQYRTIYEGGQGELIEKKSRFIATVRLVKTEEEAVKFIEEMKKKYWDATHNCSAYVIGERREIMRCSDDGEPQGTAGKPMLDVLLGEELYNTAVVVTRYFGGTLLGTIMNSQYEESVKMQVLIPANRVDEIKKAVTEATNARATVTDLKELYFAVSEGEYLLFDD